MKKIERITKVQSGNYIGVTADIIRVIDDSKPEWDSDKIYAILYSKYSKKVKYRELYPYVTFRVSNDSLANAVEHSFANCINDGHYDEYPELFLQENHSECHTVSSMEDFFWKNDDSMFKSDEYYIQTIEDERNCDSQWLEYVCDCEAYNDGFIETEPVLEVWFNDNDPDLKPLPDNTCQPPPTDTCSYLTNEEKEFIHPGLSTQQWEDTYNVYDDEDCVN